MKSTDDDSAAPGVFSDSDLKRLKAEAYDYRDNARFMWIKGPEILSLLARLEAAEFCLQDYEEAGEISPIGLERWRKVAGK